MKRKILKLGIKGFFWSAVPAACSYAASSNFFLYKLQERGIIGHSVNIPAVQDALLWIGIVWSIVLLGGNLAVSDVRRDQVTEERNGLIQMNKSVLESVLSKSIGLEMIDFDIRIFVPKHPGWYRIAQFLHIRVANKFVIKNVDLIARPGITQKLQFEVFPKQEGLVGICYHKKQMVYDDNLKETNSVSYALRTSQIDQTSSLRWSICCPIVQEDDTIPAIIALDGKSDITLSKEAMNAFRTDLTAFSRMLYDAVPQLFR